MTQENFVRFSVILFGNETLFSFADSHVLLEVAAKESTSL